MSVILDALKKLDREKSVRQNGTTNLAVEILRPDLSPSKKKVVRYLVTIFLTAMIAASITYFMTADFLSKPLTPPPMNRTATSQGMTPLPMEFQPPSASLVPRPVNPPFPSQKAPTAPVSRETVQEVKKEIDRKSSRPPVPAEGKITIEPKPAATPMDEKKEKTSMRREEPVVAPSSVKTTPELEASGSSANLPVLKLSAIVWYEDPSMRFAMVNGIKANEGSIVEGVKVVEIHPTSVRFLYNDRYFEISMQK